MTVTNYHVESLNALNTYSIGKIENHPQYKIKLGSPGKESEEHVVIIALMKNEKKCESKCELKNITFEVYNVSKYISIFTHLAIICRICVLTY